MGGCIHKHVHSFFERASHKSSSILSIDAVAGDGHQVALSSHYVTKQGKMTIIYVKPIELQYLVHFFLN